MFYRSILVAALLALTLPCFAASTTPILQQDGAPYALSGTTVLTVHAKELARDYQLFISVPSGYAANGAPLPVVFVTDADYAFPLARAIAARVGGHSKAIGPFILVGLSYALGDTPEYSRRRDYTPSTDASETYASDMPGRTPRFGEAEAYRRFIASSVLPLIAERYRADMARTVFVGHSYGSLLGTHILLASPTLFSKYVLSSPSLWYDHQIMFAREKAYAASHKEMKADVFFSIGGLEVASDGDDTDMVRDTRNFDAALKARRYAGLRTQLHLYEGKDHLDVFPDMITDALKWAVPGRK